MCVCVCVRERRGCTHFDLPPHGDDKEHDEVDDQDGPEHGDVEQRKECTKVANQNSPSGGQPAHSVAGVEC